MIAVAEQGTKAWHAERCGKVTASKFAVVMAKPRTKSAAWTQAAETYALELAAERLTGQPAESVSSRACEWGHEHEDVARMEYENTAFVFCEESGFVPLGKGIGGSPDGFTIDGEKRGIHEIKCPYTSRVHVATLLGGMPKEHKSQVQGNLFVTKLPWCDFVSFDPRMPREKRVYIERVLRDEDYIKELSERVVEFDRYVSSLLERLK